MSVIALLSAVASALTLFLLRVRGMSFTGALSEVLIVTVASIAQGITAPLALGFGLLGLLTFGAFPVWATFSLAHYTQWEPFDGIKFAAIQVCLFATLLLTFSFVFRAGS